MQVWGMEQVRLKNGMRGMDCECRTKEKRGHTVGWWLDWIRVIVQRCAPPDLVALDAMLSWTRRWRRRGGKKAWLIEQ